MDRTYWCSSFFILWTDISDEIDSSRADFRGMSVLLPRAHSFLYIWLYLLARSNFGETGFGRSPRDVQWRADLHLRNQT